MSIELRKWCVEQSLQNGGGTIYAQELYDFVTSAPGVWDKPPTESDGDEPSKVTVEVTVTPEVIAFLDWRLGRDSFDPIGLGMSIVADAVREATA